MATGVANLKRPDPFLCKRKGDSEQLLQDFKQYRAELELFLTAAETVDRHMGEPAERGNAGHTVCTRCQQEKAIIVILGGEEMNELFEHVGVVTDEDSYVRAMDKVEQGIKALNNQSSVKQFQEIPKDSQVCREASQPLMEQANRCDRITPDKSMTVKDRSRDRIANKKERGLRKLPKGCTVPLFKASQLVGAKWVMFRQRLGEQKEQYTLMDGELSMLLWEACKRHPTSA